VKGGSVDICQFFLERRILIRDAGMAKRSPEQAATIAAQLYHLCVFLS
jgi:hypothetical protein